MPGYKHPCRYCDQLVPADANVCPFCGRKNPLAARCPKCQSPVQAGWKACSHCGLTLETTCPKCGGRTFFGDYCSLCGAELVIVCPRCRAIQPPTGDKCIKCGKPLAS